MRKKEELVAARLAVLQRAQQRLEQLRDELLTLVSEHLPA